MASRRRSGKCWSMDSAFAPSLSFGTLGPPHLLLWPPAFREAFMDLTQPALVCTASAQSASGAAGGAAGVGVAADGAAGGAAGMGVAAGFRGAG